MSIYVSAAVWRLNLPPGSKLVALALADMCNDEGYCWPSVNSLVSRTGMAERTVREHIGMLADGGLLVRHERSGRSTVYQVLTTTPAESAGVRNLQDTPAESAPRSVKETSIPSTARAKPVRQTARGVRWKPGRKVDSDWLAWAREKTGWSALTVARMAEEFENYWRAKPGQDAAKLDWEATWHNWVLKEVKREEGVGRDRQQRPRRTSNRSAIADFLEGGDGPPGV